MPKQTNMPVDIFMPEYCIQGKRIPFYALWDKSKNVKVSLSLSTGLELAEVYNVDPSDVSIKNNVCVVKNFEVEGYFGGVIRSQLYDEASSVKTVKFSISGDSNSIQNFEKSIELFRPDISISKDVSEIFISNSKGKQIPNRQIPLYNHGKGTGIVKIDILDDSEIKEGIPEGFEEFKVKFLEDVKQSFDELTLKFPQYGGILSDLLEFVNDPLPSAPNRLETLRDTVTELEKAFDNNETFYEQFAQSITTSYLKNISVLTDVVAFLAFMKSIGNNNIIFIDAMKILKVSPTPRKLHANLIITDLARNEYSPIELHAITLTSNVESTIPAYQIFNTQKVNF